MTDAVLDSSAILAVLLKEPGGDVAAVAAPTSVMSAVNFAEVVLKLVARGVSEDVALAAAWGADMEVAPADGQLAELAGLIHARTRRHGISLGDSFCLALAKTRDLPVLTTDRGWAALDLGVEVRLIR